LLKKELGINRTGLVEQYTKPATNGANGCDVSEIARRMEAEQKLKAAEEKAKNYWSYWCDSEERLFRFKNLARLLADVVGVKDSRLDDDDDGGADDEVISALKEMIRGPISSAFSAFPDGTEIVVAELGKLLTDGGKTAGEIMAAIEKRPKLRQALATANHRIPRR
jgi:hypothetical protein